MRWARRPTHSGWIVALAFLAASLLAGASRRPDPGDPALALYLEAGGAVGDLCGATGDATPLAGPCDACRPVGAAVLPGPGAGWLAVRRACTLRTDFADPTGPVPSPRDRSWNPRAPPSAA